VSARPRISKRAPAREGGALISKVHQLSGRLFTSILKSYGIKELNPAQGRIVYELWKQEGMTQTELASRTKLDKSSLALMLDRLEKQGQVVRARDPADGRRRIVSLTNKNRATHGAYGAASARMISLFYKGLSGKQIETFEATLRLLITNLEEAAATNSGR
jgi:MarR family transcriptional regulator, organic hydroperoxide resistance regulator